MTRDVSFYGLRPFYDLPLVERDAAFTLSFLLPQNAYFENISFDRFLRSDDDEPQGFFDILYRTSMEAEEPFTGLGRFHGAHLTGQLARYFSNLFPNVQNLVVIHSHCFEEELHSVIELLVRSHWSLKILKLWIRTLGIDWKYEDDPDQHPICTLLQSINGQCSLQSLTLDIGGDGPDNNFSFPVESYCFITQLKVLKLYLGNYDRNDDAICDIVNLFDSAKLGRIDLGNGDHNDRPLDALLKPKLEFIHKVNQLYWNLSFETGEQFGELCWRFASLTSLQMHWSPQLTFIQLVSNLALLAQLTHLQLYMNFEFEDHPNNVFALVDRADDEDDGDEPRNQISLPRIKNLVLYIEKHSHQDFESLSPRVFPSVKVIILHDLISSPCAACQPFINSWHDHQSANRCHRLLILSLKNKFVTNPLVVRLYAKRALNGPFVDWTSYVPTEDGDDDRFEIGGDGYDGEDWFEEDEDWDDEAY